MSIRHIIAAVSTGSEVVRATLPVVDVQNLLNGDNSECYALILGNSPMFAVMADNLSEVEDWVESDSSMLGMGDVFKSPAATIEQIELANIEKVFNDTTHFSIDPTLRSEWNWTTDNCESEKVRALANHVGVEFTNNAVQVELEEIFGCDNNKLQLNGTDYLVLDSDEHSEYINKHADEQLTEMIETEASGTLRTLLNNNFDHLLDSYKDMPEYEEPDFYTEQVAGTYYYIKED